VWAIIEDIDENRRSGEKIMWKKKSSTIPKIYTMKELTLVDVSTKWLLKIQLAWWFLYQLKVRFSPEWVAQNWQVWSNSHFVGAVTCSNYYHNMDLQWYY